jgi:lysozyme
MINVVVDLSHFNASVDFQTAKANGIVGVIHKATQGTTYVDPTYAQRRGEALETGLWWGAYHFGTADDATAQAEHFLSVVQPGPSDLLVLDVEQNYSGGKPVASMSLAQAEQFVGYVQSRTGRWPGLYGGSYVKELLGDNHSPTLANCWFWLSEYGPTPKVPANWPTWTMWQYTDGVNGPAPHSIPGIGNCDRDQFNGALNDLARLWGQVAMSPA